MLPPTSLMLPFPPAVRLSYPEVVEELSSLGDRMRRDLGDSKVKGSGFRPAGRL